MSEGTRSQSDASPLGGLSGESIKQEFIFLGFHHGNIRWSMGYSTWGSNWGTYMGIRRSKRWGTIRVVSWDHTGIPPGI